MNPNEIKKALECCSDIHFCSVCPYYLQNKENDYCKEDMSKDALAYINQLEAEVERLKMNEYKKCNNLVKEMVGEVK